MASNTFSHFFVEMWIKSALLIVYVSKTQIDWQKGCYENTRRTDSNPTDTSTLLIYFCLFARDYTI